MGPIALLTPASMSSATAFCASAAAGIIALGRGPATSIFAQMNPWRRPRYHHRGRGAVPRALQPRARRETPAPLQILLLDLDLLPSEAPPARERQLLHREQQRNLTTSQHHNIPTSQHPNITTSQQHSNTTSQHHNITTSNPPTLWVEASRCFILRSKDLIHPEIFDTWGLSGGLARTAPTPNQPSPTPDVD